MNKLYQLKQLSLRYESGFYLSDINIDIEQGKTTVIVGSNGSGKTTLLNILAFLLFPDNGEIKYGDIVVDKNNLTDLKKKVGYVQQNPYLLNTSVYKNIELGLKIRHIKKQERHKTINEVMSLLGIESLSKRLVRTLSGGEAQKVAIGRVLVLEPQTLILDEPFSYLDKDATHELEKIILKLKNHYGKTIVLTTHNQLQAQWLADHIYNTNKGRMHEAKRINLFKGDYDIKTHCFNINSNSVILSKDIVEAEYIIVDPRQITLFRNEPSSDTQNKFCGKIIRILKRNKKLEILIDADEIFCVLLDYKVMKEQGFVLGEKVWLCFGHSSILIF